MNYQETLNYIKNTAKFGSNLGLSRTEKILEILGNPHKKIRTIHIAGTNGKGSTTSMISNILIKNNYKVGMYISPYLEEFEERIQINNTNISREDLCNTVTKVAKAVEEVIALGYDHPTEFEIITCTMFLYFYEQSVDFGVIEVGLGGRLDSTNVIEPLVSVITSISYDHMAILGDTLEKIAYEKAGIIKEGVPIILYPQKEECHKVIEKVCKERNSKLTVVNETDVAFEGVNDNKQLIKVKTEKDSYEVVLNLLGEHQKLNCTLVIKTMEELSNQGITITKEAILEGLRDVTWPGRMEVMSREPLIVIDGAHNIDGITKLTNSLDIYFKYNKLYLILGILADKQVEAMIKKIVPRSEKVFAVTPNSERAEISTELKNEVDKLGAACKAYEDYEKAFLEASREAKKEDLILVCGSLYMIGDMRKIIRSFLKK